MKEILARSPRQGRTMNLQFPPLSPKSRNAFRRKIRRLRETAARAPRPGPRAARRGLRQPLPDPGALLSRQHLRDLLLGRNLPGQPGRSATRPSCCWSDAIFWASGASAKTSACSSRRSRPSLDGPCPAGLVGSRIALIAAFCSSVRSAPRKQRDAAAAAAAGAAPCPQSPSGPRGAAAHPRRYMPRDRAPRSSRTCSMRTVSSGCLPRAGIWFFERTTGGSGWPRREKTVAPGKRQLSGQIGRYTDSTTWMLHARRPRPACSSSKTIRTSASWSSCTCSSRADRRLEERRQRGAGPGPQPTPSS